MLLENSTLKAPNEISTSNGISNHVFINHVTTFPSAFNYNFTSTLIKAASINTSSIPHLSANKKSLSATFIANNSLLTFLGEFIPTKFSFHIPQSPADKKYI